MKFGKYTVDIENADKMYFPDQKITKGDLIYFYDKISDYLLPYLKNRPLTLSRFPDGIEGEGFYQKEAPDYFPEWINVVEVDKKEGGSINQVICNNKATLVYLVNQGTLSCHPWLSTTDELNKPTQIVFDLDPPKDNFDLVIKGAKALRLILEEQLNLNAFVMTSGSEGLHVVCPIKPDYNFDKVRTFAKNVCEYLVEEQRDLYTTELQKEKRNGRLFLDYLRNSYAQTSIPPYSVRALKGAPVATPLQWDELDNDELTSQSYYIKNIFKRLGQKDEVWKQFRNRAISMEDKFEKLEALNTDSK